MIVHLVKEHFQLIATMIPIQNYAWNEIQQDCSKVLYEI